MSVIVRDPEGKLYLYCKGADAAIFPKITQGSNPDTMEQFLEVMTCFDAQKPPKKKWERFLILF